MILDDNGNPITIYHRPVFAPSARIALGKGGGGTVPNFFAPVYNNKTGVISFVEINLDNAKYVLLDDDIPTRPRPLSQEVDVSLLPTTKEQIDETVKSLDKYLKPGQEGYALSSKALTGSDGITAGFIEYVVYKK